MQETRLRWIVAILAIGSLIALLDLWEPLLLATWVAVLARPWQVRLSRAMRGSHRAATVLTIVLVVSFCLPLGLLTAALTNAAIDMVTALVRSRGGHQALTAIVSGGDGTHTFSLANLIHLAQQYGDRALNVFETVAHATLNALIGAFVFLYASYAFLAEGPRIYAWLMDRAPIAPEHFRRLASAFNATGRGLLVSVGLTALCQGVVATVAYLCVGVPRPFVLGFLTGVASLVPSVGTALVWVPIAVGLAAIGRWAAAIVVASVGLVLIVLVIDHLLRPALSKIGRLGLPSFAVLLGMLGGIAAFGPWGLLLGPLFLRLTMEALDIARDEGVWRHARRSTT